MLANIAAASLVVAVFSGSCAFGVGKSLGRIMRPLTYGALAVAVALYAASFIF
jgi:hypothetical protein